MNIGKVAEQNARTHATRPKSASQENQKKDSTLAADNTDKYVKSEATYVPSYTKPSGTHNGTNNAKNSTQADTEFTKYASTKQAKNAALKSMVQDTISGQAGKVSSKNLMSALNAAEATSSKHSDYWGVEATAERIFTFAKSLAGDDDEMFQTMKDAFLKGFGQATKANGGKLPSISQDTKSAVLEMFDKWESDIKSKSSASESTETSTEAADSADKTDTSYAKGKKIAYMGAEKYGSSYKAEGQE